MFCLCLGYDKTNYRPYCIASWVEHLQATAFFCSSFWIKILLIYLNSVIRWIRLAVFYCYFSAYLLTLDVNSISSKISVLFTSFALHSLLTNSPFPCLFSPTSGCFPPTRCDRTTFYSLMWSNTKYNFALCLKTQKMFSSLWKEICRNTISKMSKMW